MFAETPLVQSFVNTVYVTVASIVLMLLIGSCAAFGMILRSSRFTVLFGTALLIGFVIPGQSTLIPLYRMLVDLGLIDSLTGLVVFYARLDLLLLPDPRVHAHHPGRDPRGRPYRRRRRVPDLLEDRPSADPPVLVTVGVFQTMWIWNDFITPTVFISSQNKQTLVLQVYTR